MGRYETLADAAAAGIALIAKQEDSGKNEYIGIIYQDLKTGHYLITDPKGQSQKGKSKGAFTVPAGSARGIYHNHPFDAESDRDKAASKRRYFSQDDIEIADRTGLKSFIGVGDELLLWDPDNPGRTIRQGHGRRMTIQGKGTPVLARIPIGIIDALQQKRRTKHGMPPLVTTHDGFSAVQNPDGSFSTELSITVTDPRLNNGRATNIPSLWGRQVVPQEEAIKRSLASGREFQSFESIDAAIKAAIERSNKKGRK